MRQRERERIARRRTEYRAASAQLVRAEKQLAKLGIKGKRGEGRRHRDDLRASTLGLYQAAQVARGKLALAISRPVEARFADIRARPERHREGSKARALADSHKAKEKILDIRKPPAPADARAFKQVRAAIENGEDAADVYKEISESTGLSARVIYSMIRSPDKWGVAA
jgi:hypothetical protein